MKLSVPLPGWLKAQEEPQVDAVIEPVELVKPALMLFCMVCLVVVSSLLVIWSAHQYRILFNQQQELAFNSNHKKNRNIGSFLLG